MSHAVEDFLSRMLCKFIGHDGHLGSLVLPSEDLHYPVWVSEKIKGKEGDTIGHLAGIVKTSGSHIWNTRTCHSFTPLHLICSIHSPGQLEVVKAICSHENPDVLVRDSMKRTPLHHALSTGNLKYHVSLDGGLRLVQLVKMLIAFGADVNAEDCSGLTPFAMVLDGNNEGVVGNLFELPELIKTFITAGAATSQLIVRPTVGEIAELASTPLHLACLMSGFRSVDAVNILASPENVNTRDSLLRTPLHIVIETVKNMTPALPRDSSEPNWGVSIPFPKIKILLSFGADVNARDSLDLTPLERVMECCGVESGLPLFEFLLLRSGNASLCNDRGVTLLHTACLRCEKYLPILCPPIIKAGCHVDARDQNGQTPFHWALRSCSVNTLQYLCQLGANPIAVDKNQNNSIHEVCSRHRPDFKNVVEFLLQKGVGINDFNAKGETPLINLLMLPGNPESVKTLIHLGADVNVTNNDGKTALQIVCCKRADGQHLGSSVDDIICQNLSVLIESGANVNAEDDLGNPPLLYAIRKGSNLSIVRTLLESGACVNKASCTGITPLQIAVREKNAALTKLLLNSGADLNQADGSGRTLLHLATLYHSRSKMTRENPGPNLSSSDSNNDVISVLVEAGADVNKRDISGASPLLNAVMHAVDGDPTAVTDVRLLLCAGADVNVGERTGTTPLHMAAFHGAAALTRLLLDFGANVNQTDGEGQTPLHQAVQSVDGYGNSTARILIDRGADPGVFDSHRSRPLAYMNNRSYPYYVRYTALLVAAGQFSLIADESILLARWAEKHTSFSACLSCALRMNECPIGRSNLTQVLLTPPDRVAPLIRNQLNSFNVDEFVEYGSFIQNKWTQFINYNDLKTRAVSFLCRLDLPVLISEKIVSYLKESDLMCLHTAFDFEDVKEVFEVSSQF